MSQSDSAIKPVTVDLEDVFSEVVESVADSKPDDFIPGQNCAESYACVGVVIVRSLIRVFMSTLLRSRFPILLADTTATRVDSK